VLEPLACYLCLAEALSSDPAPPCEAFNFGPQLESNRPVRELIASILSHWPGEWIGQ
jgi:CDP-glucose 4,6-dehydratase